MKKILIAAVLAVIWSAPVRAEDTHESLADDAFKAFNEFADTLAMIKDKESWEKVKESLKKTGMKLADVKARFDKIGEPKGDKKDEIEKKYKPKMEEIQKKVQSEYQRIANKVPGGREILNEVNAALAPPPPPAKEIKK